MPELCPHHTIIQDQSGSYCGDCDRRMRSSAAIFAKQVLESLDRDMKKLKIEHAEIADKYAYVYMRSWLEARLRREAQYPELPLDVLDVL